MRTLPALIVFAALTSAPSPLLAACSVMVLDVRDQSRTVGIPYASPADSGATPVRVRSLVYMRAGAPVKQSGSVSYAKLITDVVPGVDAAEHLNSRLRFYGATTDSNAVATAIQSNSACRSTTTLTKPTRGVVVVLGAFPSVMYEGLAQHLAERDIATVVSTGTESNVRFILNHLSTLGWPVDKLVLVGHGASGPVVNLMAMSSSFVRGVVSLDGFEALNRARHPGLTGDPSWRPGNLRAPMLHIRPSGHPDADTLHHALAARSELVQITINNVIGQQFMTAPEVALAPIALQNLIGANGADAQVAATRAAVSFINSVLNTGRVDVEGIRASVPSTFGFTHRPALPTPAIRTDGRLNEAVWSTARTLADATTVSVRIADDCDYVYVAVAPRRSAPFITEVFIGKNDSNPGLTSHDLLLHASASLCWVYGKADVASTDCNKSEAWWSASRTNQAGDQPVGEYVVAKRAIGLARCEGTSRLRIGALVGGWGPNEVFPAGADKGRPGSWALVR